MALVWRRFKHGEGTHTYRSGPFEICQMADNYWRIFKKDKDDIYQDAGHEEITLRAAKRQAESLVE